MYFFNLSIHSISKYLITLLKLNQKFLYILPKNVNTIVRFERRIIQFLRSSAGPGQAGGRSRKENGAGTTSKRI